jgi:hypothetical protein
LFGQPAIETKAIIGLYLCVVNCFFTLL